MSQKISQRQRLLFLVAGISIALLILDRIAFTPLTALWRSHAAEITRLEADVANGTSLINRAQSLQQTWADMQARALPKDPSQAEQDLITALDRCRRTSGIELGSIKPQWKRGITDRSSLLECRIDATGSLATLGRFAYEVEKSSLALRIDSLAMSTRDETGQKIALELVVTGLRLSPLEAKR
jgi:hypothetical protein